MKYDAVIVGAGPAGSTTARFAALAGLKVLMVDKRREIGYPVQCGEFMPERRELENMFPRSEGNAELFDTPAALVSLRTGKLKLVSPGGKGYLLDFEGYTVDRRVYDKHLVELARRVGAELRLGVVARKVDGGRVLTSEGELEATVVVGADGPVSRVAECTGLPANETMAVAMTCQVDGTFEPVAEMYFGGVAPGGYAWIIPKKGCANVGLGIQKGYAGGKVRRFFERFTASRGFRGREVSAGFVPMSGPLRRTVKGNVLLVGDSAGHVMASNGGGIPTAMVCGRLAGKTVAEHVLRGAPLEGYEGAWRRAIGREMGNALSTKRMADRFFGSDRLLGLSMRLLGRTGLARAIRCQRLLPW